MKSKNPSNLATASCRLANQVEGMWSARHIISQLTLLPNNSLHAIIFPTHIAHVVVRLALAVSNINGFVAKKLSNVSASSCPL